MSWRGVRIQGDFAAASPAAGGRGYAEFFQLGAAELARRRDLAATARAAHRLGVERHRVFARADQNIARAFRHLVFSLFRLYL